MVMDDLSGLSSEGNNPYALVNHEMGDELFQKLPFSTEESKEAGPVFLIEERSASESSDGTPLGVLGLGFGCLLSGFYYIYHGVKRIISADKHYDFEAKIESSLRLCALPLAMTNSAEGSLVLFLVLAAISLSAVVLGSLVLFIEFGLELYRFLTIKVLDDKLSQKEIEKLLKLFEIDRNRDTNEQIRELQEFISQNLEKLEKHLSKEHIENLQRFLKQCTQETTSTTAIERQLRATRIFLTEAKIQKIYTDYLSITSDDKKLIEARVTEELKTSYQPEQKDVEAATSEHTELMQKGKRNMFARRVGKFMAKKLEDHRLDYSLYIEGYAIKIKQFEEKSRHVYFQLFEQTKKAMKIHVVGIIAILLGMVMMALSYLGAPMAPIASLGVLGMTLQTARTLAPKSYLDQEGSQFSLEPQKDTILGWVGLKKKHFEWIEMESFSTPASL